MLESKKKAIIVGGGPAGLFCAYLLLKKGVAVDLYDQSSGLAKKFLIAGNGGLNLTHSEDLPSFARRYGKDEKLFAQYLESFSPTDLREWCQEMGTETFVGTSGRVFPKEMSAGKVLINWTNALKAHPHFSLFLKHRMTHLSSDGEVTFESEEGAKKIRGEKVVLALGGASWKKTGSDGLWKPLLEELGIEVKTFLPMNCGFERSWSAYFQEAVDRAPLKHVEVSLEDGKKAKGDLMLTPYGIEGGVIYALSNHIRDNIFAHGKATLFLDLKPNLSQEAIAERLKKKPSKMSMSNFLRKTLKLEKHAFILLKEVLPSLENLEDKIKKLPIEVTGIRPIDEAISTSGGVAFDELSDSFECKKLKGVFICGEMLDYEAPTGGYLLQGCFSTAFIVANKIIKDLE